MFSFVNFIPDSPLLAFRSEALAYRLFHGRSLASRGEPFGVSFGIVGAGLSFKHTAPLLLTTKKYLAVGEVARIAEMGNAIEAMTEAGMQPDEWLDTLVLGVDDPVQQLDPGDAITGGAMNGTAGPPVTWPGKHGILTCEHVTGSKATVSCAGTAVSVIKSLNVSSTGFDVSLLELKGSLLTRYGKGSI